MADKPCIGNIETTSIEKVSLSEEPYRKIQNHPCFSSEARHQYGRMHLAVAPLCQIQCNYCERRFDCVNESRPGVTSRVLSPLEALQKVKETITVFPFIRVIGIAGPGEPLYNRETFDTLSLIRDQFPDMKLCLSTNGLALIDSISTLSKLKVHTITVTMNTIYPNIGAQIYSFINFKGKYLKGLEAAKILIERQLTGIQQAVEKGLIVKVNSVLIPGINDGSLIDLAKQLQEIKVYTMNIIPLLPQPNTIFGSVPPPTVVERQQLQKECGAFIKQMTWCRQCRADAIGLLERDISGQMSKTCQN